MSASRLANPGKTRSCPHCKATILESASVCPGCNHHLRFDSAQRVQPSLTPLRVEGAIRHPATGGAWEYSFVLAVRNSRGEEIARQVVGVGALQPSEERTFTLAVEVFTAADLKESRPLTKDLPAATKDTRPASGPPPLPPDPRLRIAPAPEAKFQATPRQVPPPLTRPKEAGTVGQPSAGAPKPLPKDAK